MGKTANSGLAHGTKGSPQQTLEQENLISKIKNNTKVSSYDINKLKVAGVKYKKDDVIFVANDTEGKQVWLETGTNRAGLRHALFGVNNSDIGHEKDFATKFGVQAEAVPNLIKQVVTKGTLLSSRSVERKGINGYEKIYSYHGKKVLVAEGNNGFIITAYPL